MAALLIVVNLSVINTFAVMAAPVAAGEFAEVLIALLLGAGHSQSELNGMGVTQMQSLVTNDMNSGKITLDTPIVDPVSGASMSFYQFMSSPENTAARAIITLAFNNFIDDILNPSDNSHGGVNHGGGSSAGTRKGVEDYFIPTSTMDMKGLGAVVVATYIDSRGQLRKEYLYSDYIIVDGDFDNFTYYQTFGKCHYSDYIDGNLYFDYDCTPASRNRSYFENLLNVEFYGDVRYEDGTEYPTIKESEYVLGEADGTKVTVDMLNPDGTVTIDGVTYYPADYVDPDKLTEEGKKQIINNITNVINNTYVKSEEEPLVDEDDITVEVAEELENFTVSPSIITVFPFSLPWDFVRGMKLLSAKPVTPHFEITIDVPAILNVPAQKWTLEIDLGKFETLAIITRWTSLFGFVYLLISLSTKIVKGAGA